jgi:AcrR family transcriptional regulator
MEAVAARAGVGKATLYRRYGSKVELVFAHTIHPGTLHAPDTGSLRGDLRLLGTQIVAAIGPPTAVAALPGLLADLAREPQLRERFQSVFIASERTVVAEVLERAQARGELVGSVDPDLVHALMLGSIFAAIFLLDLPPSGELGERLAALTTTALERTPPR